MAYTPEMFKALYKEKLKQNSNTPRPRSSLHFLPRESKEELNSHFSSISRHNSGFSQCDKDNPNSFKLLKEAHESIKRTNMIKQRAKIHAANETGYNPPSQSISFLLRSNRMNRRLKRAESTQYKTVGTPFIVKHEKDSIQQQRINLNKALIENRICEVNHLVMSKSLLLPKRAMINTSCQTPRELNMKFFIKQKTNGSQVVFNRDRSKREVVFPIDIKQMTRRCFFENKEIDSVLNRRKRKAQAEKKSQCLQVDNSNEAKAPPNYVRIHIKGHQDASTIASPRKKKEVMINA